MDPFATRREKLRKQLRALDVDALVVSNFANVTYLTGFTGDDSYLILGRQQDLVLSDPRYGEQLQQECPGLELFIRKPGEEMLAAVAQVARSAGLGRLAVEGDSLSVARYQKLAEKLPKTSLRVTSGVVERLRQVKDKFELAEIRQAIRYAERAFTAVRETLRPERTEQEVANQLEYQMRDLGAKAASFPTIVAAGARASLAHARPSEAAIGQAGFVLIDWGAQGRLYKSDLTRLVVTARISPKLKRVYGVVLEAQLRAIAAIRPGVPANQIDGVARGVIADAGFGRHFGHSLGHGIGLDIHEAPRLASTNAEPLQPGMVVTVEPGIYLPGWGGVRIEDDCLVTRDGCEVLTTLPKGLEEAVLG